MASIHSSHLSSILGAAMAMGFCFRSLVADEASSRQRFRFDADWRFHLDEFPQANTGTGIAVVHWRWKKTEPPILPEPLQAAADCDISGTDWQDVSAPTPDLFGSKNGFAWLRASLPPVPGRGTGERLVLHFESVDDNATVFLNGRKLSRHEGWGEPFDVPLDVPSWNPNGKNSVAVLVENTDGGGGIPKTVTLRVLPERQSVPEPALASFDDKRWRKVHLPHDFVVEGAFDPKGDAGHGSLPVPQGWYRRSFVIPKQWQGKSLWVDFDGIFSDSKIWFNGQWLGGRRSGYVGGRYDLARCAKYGETNTLAVLVDPSKKEGWWYEGGGIYRHVWLNVADRLHIEPCGVFAKSVVEGDCLKNPEPPARLEIQVSVVNDAGEDRSFVVETQVIDPDGKPVASVASGTHRLKPSSKAEIKLGVPVAKAMLWSLEAPRLYRLATAVRSDGRAVDTEATSFGIRTIRFDQDQGFLLNGKPVKIKGTCNHQDFAGIGIALPDAHHSWRVRKLQACGCNAYRTSHNTIASEMLDACDRLGMLVMDETRHFGDTYATKSSLNTPSDDLSDLADMVRRDRNHPSVIVWSIANEEVCVERTKDAERIGLAMRQRINVLDGSRPITAAGIEHFAGYPGLSNAVDVEGFNYGSPENYDRYHKEHPSRPELATETASAISTRGIYCLDVFKRAKGEFWGDEARGYINAFGLSPSWGHVASACWKPVAERPFVAGAFVWTGLDYRGEPHPFGWPVINSHFGFMDTCGFPKEDYYYYLAWWGAKPVVHLATHWASPTGTAGVKVLCHANTERVELWLNGRKLGSKAMPRFGYLEWQAPFEPGSLEARGFNGDEMVASDKVAPAEPAVALRLSTDCQAIFADDEDQSVVEVSVVDKKGRIVPTAGNEIAFRVEGPGLVAGVGNGDPSCHEPDKAGKRHAFNGRCIAVVQASGAPGQIIVTASSPGMQSACLPLRSLSCPRIEFGAVATSVPGASSR